MVDFIDFLVILYYTKYKCIFNIIKGEQMKRFFLGIIITLLLLTLCLLFVVSCKKEKKEPEKIVLDYANNTYVGYSLKNFSSFFDEQNTADPRNGNNADVENSIGALDSDGDGDIDSTDKEHYFELAIDLRTEYDIECVYVYFPVDGAKVLLETGTPFDYEDSFSATCTAKWNRIDIDKNTRYISFSYQNAIAPSEILVYGVQTGKDEVVNTEPTERKTMSYLIGMNANVNFIRSPNKIASANYIRDYVNWLWCYEPGFEAGKPTTFNGSFSQYYSAAYKTLRMKKVDVVPCYMFGSEVVKEGYSKIDPAAYAMYGELLYQAALRFGNNPVNTVDKVVCAGAPRFNLDTISWIEAGNEPNGEGNDGFTPYEIAALTSVSYDGHCNTVTALSGSGVGVKNADPNMKLAMAGLAGVGTRYIQAMTFWMEHNRADGKIAMDAFNVHTYCRKTEQYNGYTISYGVCPEAGGITDQVKELTAWRDKYYPGVEVWMTEFGWDTNESWETENACHAYGEYTARELQAMWLVRAYFMFAGVGVDRCAMYMVNDLGDDATSVGKYGTSGLLTVNGQRKESYYYIYTLSTTMADMYFAEIIDSGNENVWIYRFENGQGKSCYAVWCPTMDSVSVDDYVLSIDGTSATLTEFAYGETSGVSSELTVSNGSVTVDISECPVLIFSE